MRQATKHIMMVRPKHFGYDPQTAGSNAFQVIEGADRGTLIEEKAISEFNGAVEKLRSKGIEVTIIEDTDSPVKPNAVFPNNWVSFHNDRVILYPMLAQSRRAERRVDIIERFNLVGHRFEQIVDLSGEEENGLALESTGSIIFDYANEMAYACLSPRTDEGLFKEVCELLNYEPVIFHSRDERGQLIYHTNVMMCIAAQYAVICLESIDAEEREAVAGALEKTGHQLVDITMEQVHQFAGNMFEVEGTGGQSYLVMSKAAFDSLREDQIEQINQYSEIIAIPIPTIEKYGGGSIRCMMCRVN